jgi:hypothetical protein
LKEQEERAEALAKTVEGNEDLKEIIVDESLDHDEYRERICEAAFRNPSVSM